MENEEERGQEERMNVQPMKKKGYCVAISNALKTLLKMDKSIFSEIKFIFDLIYN